MQDPRWEIRSASVFEDAGGIADYGGPGLDIVQHDRPHADKGLLANVHALAKDGAGADVGRAADAA